MKELNFKRKTYVIPLLIILLVAMTISICWIWASNDDKNSVRLVDADAPPSAVIEPTEEMLNAMPNVLAHSDLELSASSTDSYFCLRDQIAIFTQDQAGMGLCWNFSANTVLETMLSLKYGELYDFSDVYSVFEMNNLRQQFLGDSYTIGEGANFTFFPDIIKNIGFMLECDLPYEEVFGIDDTNREEIFQSLQDYTLASNMFGDFLYADFRKYNSLNSTSREAKINQIQSWITTNGAVTASVYSTPVPYSPDSTHTYYVNYCSTNIGINHAVTIIGWDDTFSYAGTSGAWIAVNSWGNSWGDDGIFYIPYEDKTVDTLLYGMTINESKTPDVDVRISESSANFENHYNGKYRYLTNESTLTSNYVSQKNLFYDDQSIELCYDYNLKSSNDYELYVSMRGVNCDAKSNFNYSVNKNSQEIVVTSKNTTTESGTYILTLKFDLDSDGDIDKEIVKQIFVFDGLHIGSIHAYHCENKNGSLTTTALRDFYAFNSFNESQNEFDIYTNGVGFYVSVDLGSYNTATSYILDGASAHSSTFFEPADANSFSYASVCFFVSLAYSNQATIKLKVYENSYYVTYTFTIKKTSSFKAYVHYDLNGASNLDEQNIFMFSSDDEKRNINNPTGDKNFGGWFLDKNFTIPLTHDAGQYYLTLDQMTKILDGNNYYDNNLSANSTRYVVVLYAKWIDEPLVFQVETLQLVTDYGKTINQTLPTLSGGSGHYAYRLENAKNWILLGNNVLICQSKQAGTFVFNLIGVDILSKNTVTCIVTLTVNTLKITYIIENKTSKYGENIAELTGYISSGDALNNEDLQITLSTDATMQSPVGTYDIVGTAGNTNYDVTFINGTYTIGKNTMIVDVQNYSGTYDKFLHSASIVPQITDNYQILYSWNGIDFVETPISIKDSNDLSFYFRITGTRNYEDYEGTARINILPASVSVKWLETNLVYNGQMQFPAYVIDNPLQENILVKEIGASTFSENTLTAQLMLDISVINYTLLNDSCNFIIAKADFDVFHQDYNKIYDNQVHTMDFEIKTTFAKNVNITYSLDGLNYQNDEPTFKNVIDANMFVRLQADCFNEKIIEISVKINPYPISINWGETQLKYNGKEQFPAFSYINDLDEELVFTKMGAYKNASDSFYSAKLALDGEQKINYTILNPTCNYKIIKTTADAPKPYISSAQIDSAHTLKDISLPKGYKWVNPDAKLEVGKHQYQIIFTSSDFNLEPQTFYVTLEKEKTSLSWIYLAIGGFSVVILAVLVAVLIKKRKSLFAGDYDEPVVKEKNVKNPKNKTTINTNAKPPTIHNGKNSKVANQNIKKPVATSNNEAKKPSVTEPLQRPSLGANPTLNKPLPKTNGSTNAQSKQPKPNLPKPPMPNLPPKK